MICTKLTAGSRVMAAAFGFVMVAAAASAAVFNIPDGDVAALKNAIAAANNNNENDIINLAAGGDYVLTVVDHTTTGGPTGLPAFGADNGNIVTINGNGAAIARSSAAGTPEFRILEVGDGNADVTVETCSSPTENSSVHQSGAGILNLEGRITLVGCTLSGNNAGLAGGGLANATFSPQGLSRLIASNCTISGNTAPRGAGVSNQSFGNAG